MFLYHAIFHISIHLHISVHLAIPLHHIYYYKIFIYFTHVLHDPYTPLHMFCHQPKRICLVHSSDYFSIILHIFSRLPIHIFLHLRWRLQRSLLCRPSHLTRKIFPYPFWIHPCIHLHNLIHPTKNVVIQLVLQLDILVHTHATYLHSILLHICHLLYDSMCQSHVSSHLPNGLHMYRHLRT